MTGAQWQSVLWALRLLRLKLSTGAEPGEYDKAVRAGGCVGLALLTDINREEERQAAKEREKKERERKKKLDKLESRKEVVE
jgi:hypothetical protein